ncbi:MAG: ABC transporter ATP-binding protein [Verrucomicrobia bacterium]|nr:ABC transporter ATP-binding protein [Cytophagales bacterium]
MQIYLRLLSYTRNIMRLALPYFIFSALATIFSLVSFGLIIPILKLLFSPADGQQLLQPIVQPQRFDAIGWINFYLKYLITEYGKLETLKWVCLTVIASSLLTNTFKYMAVRINEFWRTEVVYNLRKATFDKISSFHIGYFTNERRGDLISRLTADVQEVETTITNNLSRVLKEPFTLVGYFVWLFYMSPQLTFFSLILIPVVGLFIAFLVKKLKGSANAGQSSLGKLLGMIDETLSGMKVIKAFNGTDFVKQKFDQENRHYTGLMRYIAYRRELAPAFSEFMGVSLAAIILYYGGSLVLSNTSNLQPEEFITYIALFTQISKPVREIAQVFSSMQKGTAAGRRVLEVLDTQTQIADKDEAQILTHFSGRIDFQKVSFSYGSKQTLKNINFSIPKGKTVALVGQAGSGKSTLANLAMRFYEVDKGKILIDGTDIKDFSLESLRSQMGMVTQESILFNDTVFNNIAFGNPNATLKEVIKAATIANAHDFIMQKEEGYQTIIGDRGAKLSGGQQQRLTIARAVFKNPPILILDEATSALDTESEKLVQDALVKLMANRTVLVIAHRLSTIQHADEIIVLHNGEIIERGRHEILMEKENGQYKKFNLLQMS